MAGIERADIFAEPPILSMDSCCGFTAVKTQGMLPIYACVLHGSEKVSRTLLVVPARRVLLTLVVGRLTAAAVTKAGAELSWLLLLQKQPGNSSLCRHIGAWCGVED